MKIPIINCHRFKDFASAWQHSNQSTWVLQNYQDVGTCLWHVYIISWLSAQHRKAMSLHWWQNHSFATPSYSYAQHSGTAVIYWFASRCRGEWKLNVTNL